MIKNITKGTVIAGNLKLINNPLAKSVGLLGKKKAENIYFYTRFGIHTFGMKFPIDVLILDKKFKVASTKENLKPNRMFLWNPKYCLVIELENGSIKKSKTQVNDILKIDL